MGWKYRCPHLFMSLSLSGGLHLHVKFFTFYFRGGWRNKYVYLLLSAFTFIIGQAKDIAMYIFTFTSDTGIGKRYFHDLMSLSLSEGLAACWRSLGCDSGILDFHHCCFYHWRLKDVSGKRDNVNIIVSNNPNNHINISKGWHKWIHQCQSISILVFLILLY